MSLQVSSSLKENLLQSADLMCNLKPEVAQVVVADNGKDRFELVDEWIRARQGHSTQARIYEGTQLCQSYGAARAKVNISQVDPGLQRVYDAPSTLLHGTWWRNVAQIREPPGCIQDQAYSVIPLLPRWGISKMTRDYVHLTTDKKCSVETPSCTWMPVDFCRRPRTALLQENVLP